MQIIPTTRQNRYFKIARENALESNHTRHRKNHQSIKIGAVIVKGNYVVSEGCNKTKTHTQQHFNNLAANYLCPSPRIHAEVDALMGSRYNDISGCEMFIYRELNDGRIGDCKPCKSCREAISKAGIKHLYYTSEEGYCYERI